MTRNLRAKVRDFVRQHPTTLFTAVLVALLAIGAWALWAGQISYASPGPAIATVGLAVVFLIVGLVISALQAENRNLSRDVTWLQEELKNPSHLPRVVGLEILVNRWQTFKRNIDERDSVAMYEQVLIAQQIFNKKGTKKITFIKAFSGSKLEGGAFLVWPQNMEMQVLKFDRIENLKREYKRFNTCVQGRLDMYAPSTIDYWPPQSVWDQYSDSKRGAIVYTLAQTGLNSNLQTVGQYYMEKNPDLVADALKHVLSVMAPTWWNVQIYPHEDHGCSRKSDNPDEQGLYYEYRRLNEKLDALEQCWQAVCSQIGMCVVADANDERFFYLRDERLLREIRLRHPIRWVRTAFADLDTFNQQYGDLENIRRDSIIHGDFHAGNILIEEDNHTRRIWLIDFPHTHIGPIVQDIARLEADIKFGLLPVDSLDITDLYDFETALLPQSEQQPPPMAALKPMRVEVLLDSRFQKAWQAVCVLRDCVMHNSYLPGNDARPYYLALLHATLPMLCYSDRSQQQRLYAFLSAALLCERLS